MGCREGRLDWEAASPSHGNRHFLLHLPYMPPTSIAFSSYLLAATTLPPPLTTAPRLHSHPPLRLPPT